MNKSKIVRVDISLVEEIKRQQDTLKQRGIDAPFVSASKVVATRSKTARFFEK